MRPRPSSMHGATASSSSNSFAVNATTRIGVAVTTVAVRAVPSSNASSPATDPAPIAPTRRAPRVATANPSRTKKNSRASAPSRVSVRPGCRSSSAPSRSTRASSFAVHPASNGIARSSEMRRLVSPRAFIIVASSMFEGVRSTVRIVDWPGFGVGARGHKATPIALWKTGDARRQGVSVLDVRLCGGVEVEADRRALPEALFGGRQGRLVFAFLVCERHRAVRREELADLLWPEQLPESWSASLSAVVSRLRRLLTKAGLEGASALVSAAGSYQLVLPTDTTVDIEQLAAAVAEAETAAHAGDLERAVQAASAAEQVAARGFLTDDCDWVDQWRATVHDLRVRAALARSVAYLAAGSSGRAVDAARDALALDSSREAAFRQVMRALAAAGERGEALRVWERCRITLVDELGVDPAPETEAVYLEILGASAAAPAALQSLPSGVVTFLLTDIVESSAMWEEQATAMAAALERHDALVAAVVAAHGGTLLKSKLEGDATVSVFARATEGAVAALALLDAIERESWPEGASPRLRMAMHTGEAFERGGDYFGPALNRAARLRSLAAPNEVLLSRAVAELV